MNKDYMKKIYEKSRLDWIWKHDKWLSSPTITQNKLLIQAHEILDREKYLRDNFGDQFFKEIMAEHFANEIQKSWAIENINLNTFAIRSILVNALNIDIHELKLNNEEKYKREQAAVKAALFLLNSKEKFSFELVCQTHKLLKKYSEDINWGSIRKNEIHVVRQNEDNDDIQIDYIGPPSKDIPKLMNEFFAWWDDSRNILLKPIGAALAHLYFVVIHPFENGNGRIARMLTYKYMIDEGNLYTAYRPYSISSEIYKNVDQYYDVIKDFSQNGNIFPYLEYTLECHRIAVKHASFRAYYLQDLKDKLGESWNQFNFDEKELLKYFACSHMPNLFEDIQLYLESNKKSKSIYDHFTKCGIIKNKKINYTKALLYHNVKRKEDSPNSE